MRTTIAAAGMAILFMACSNEITTSSSTLDPVQSKSTHVRSNLRRKAGGVVQIEAIRLGKTDATLRVTCFGKSKNVGVKIYGLDELVVFKSTPVSKASFEAGDSVDIEVLFRPGPGESRLAAQVTGEFRQIPGSRAVSFKVGKPSSEQIKVRTHGVQTDAEGRRIRTSQAIRG